MATNRLVILPDFMIFLKLIYKYNIATTTDIHEETQITYAHIHHMKNMMIEHGWVEVIEKGARKYMTLTEEGLKVAAVVNLMLKVLNIPDDEMINYRKIRSTKHKKLTELSMPEKPKKKDEVVTL